MAECPISLEKVISTNPPMETWRIAPHPFNLNGKCTVKVTVDGTPVTGTGQYGNIHITGWGGINGAIVLEPPPTKGTIIWDVICPDCTKQLRHNFSAPPAPVPPQPKGCLKGVFDALRAIGRIRPGR